MRPAPDGFDPAVWAALEEARAHMTSGDVQGALTIYRRAWDDRLSVGDHYHACVIAHMAGAAETDITRKHDWNLAAIREADAVADRDRVRDVYASNYNNLGMSHATLGQHEAARESFERALAHVRDLTPGAYADQVKAAIERNLSRLSGPRT